MTKTLSSALLLSASAIALGACLSSETPKSSAGSAGTGNLGGSAGAETVGGNASAGDGAVSGSGSGGQAGEPVGGNAGSGGVGDVGENHEPDDAPEGDAPSFGDQVLIFDPSMSMTEIQARLDQIKSQQTEFADGRWAYLFEPGSYALDVRIGYYTQLLGLGKSPDDVVITGAVRSKPELADNNATTTFWKAVENFSVVPTQDNAIAIWAVSQGTSMRRAHIKGELHLSDNGWSSGGFIADSVVDTAIVSGSQQQFFTRNTELTKWTGGAYDMVFVGDRSTPAAAWPNYSIVEKTPLIREKPYLYLDDDGNYFVRTPWLKRSSQGPSWDNGAAADGRSVTLGKFYVAKPESDTAQTLNAALAQGKHLLLTPGMYALDAPLEVTNKDTIVMGLGLATLIAQAGEPLIRVADVDGVKLAGLVLQAGLPAAPTLLELGAEKTSVSHAQNPTSLHDISCRIGGDAQGKAESCVTVNSNDVLGDNLWLWRADHGTGAGWGDNQSKHGIVVNGDDVTMYALFSEHFQEYQTLWNGERGRTYFYQSELPYDPPDNDVWQHDGVKGYASYKVADEVKQHQALGLGVYLVMFHDVSSDNAIEAPTGAGVSMHHLVTTCFGNSGRLEHIINGTGDYVAPGHTPSFSPD